MYIIFSKNKYIVYFSFCFFNILKRIYTSYIDYYIYIHNILYVLMSYCQVYVYIYIINKIYTYTYNKVLNNTIFLSYI